MTVTRTVHEKERNDAEKKKMMRTYDWYADCERTDPRLLKKRRRRAARKAAAARVARLSRTAAVGRVR